MNKKLLIISSALALFFLILILLKSAKQNKNEKIISPVKQGRVWQIKSVDTMKYSRDLSLEKLNNLSFDAVINAQVKAIKELNATHVAIGTPYDDRFIPILTRWVNSARKYGLNVWFRGNFAGWEGWFGESRSLSREEHLRLTREFIQKHPDLFRNGDIFSPCPECENGGPEDPRHQTPVAEHRKFLIDQRNAALEEFNRIGKKVTVLDSMNFDVAKLVMDRETAGAMGGIVAIDHYVKNPQKLSQDIADLAAKTDAKIFLGEFGVPIPDIHGRLSDEEQAVWVEEVLSMISRRNYVIGINYWVSHGGSTEIFAKDNLPKPAAKVLKSYFSLKNLD